MVAGYWLLVAGCWLLVTGLLVTGCWLPDRAEHPRCTCLPEA